jgi:5-amino-6-(5-phospho-D-ribitylamino)uracil phosphatase
LKRRNPFNTNSPPPLTREGHKGGRLIKNHYRLLVADIDGTLLGKSRTISDEDKEALARVCDLGMQVSLSTGRVAQASLRIINQLSLDGCHIFSDGALVSNPQQGEEVYVQPISKAVVRQAVDFAHLNEIDLEFYSTTHYFAERESWSTDIRRQFFDIEPTIIDFTDLWQRERIIKGTLTVTSPEEKAKAGSFCLQFKVSLNFSGTKSPAYPEVDFINVLAPGVSKGKALEALASHMGISMNEIMAIGDGANDISLLSSVGLAIAMGNAPDEVKAVADYVTLDVDHSGLAAAIEQFLL